MKKLIINLLHRVGYDLVRRNQRSSEIQGLMDLTDEERSIISAAKPFTMTSHERMASLVESAKFIVDEQYRRRHRGVRRMARWLNDDHSFRTDGLRRHEQVVVSV